MTGKQLASPGVSEMGGMAENQAFLPEEGAGACRQDSTGPALGEAAL